MDIVKKPLRIQGLIEAWSVRSKKPPFDAIKRNVSTINLNGLEQLQELD